MSATRTPHITEVDPNAPAFRGALDRAGAILAGTGLNVYSRHHHYETAAAEVLFEEPVGAGELALYPVPIHDAVGRGLPSCWAFAADGTVVVLRYASKELHEHTDLDVTSEALQTQLAAIGRAFAAAGIQDVLEVNVAGHLFPAGKGRLTLEVTDELARRQVVTIIPETDAVRSGKWAVAACWSFTDQGAPVVTGICATDSSTNVH